MKKIILSFVCLLLVSVYAYADQTLNGRQPREWSQSTSENNGSQAGKVDYSDNTTVYANLAVTGNQATGNPGHIIFTATNNNGVVFDYYLWVDATAANGVGQLYMASFPLLTSNPKVWTSFPWGDWRNSATNSFASAVKVSTQ